MQVFGLSLGKWLLKATMSGTPKLMVRLLQSYSYRVQTGEPDMLSLAFRFEPVIGPPKDRSGLTPLTKEAGSPPDEQQLALELSEAILGIEDIDRKLHDDAELFQKMVKKSGDLLATVHYDPAAYTAWAAKDSWHPQRARSRSL